MANSSISRRKFTTSLVASSIGLVACSGITNSPEKEPKTLPKIDQSDRESNVKAYLKIISDLSDKSTYRYHTGRILAVPKHRHLGEPFLDFIAIKQDRVRHLGDGTYQHGYRGVIMFTDVKTNKIIDEFNNPLTNEVNQVKHFKTSKGSIVYGPEGVYSLRVGADPSPMKSEKDDPFRLKWSGIGDDAWVTYDERFAINDKKGKLLYADSSLYRYRTKMEALQDPSISSAAMTMSWSTETKFWSWMNMDDHPGHLIFGSMGSKYDSVEKMPSDILAQVEERLPDHLNDEIDWSEYKI